MMLRNLDDKLPMAPNFKYGEFVYSYNATRFGIKNEPNEEQWRNIEKTAECIAQPVREKLGRLRISSGFRSPRVNKLAGGSNLSRHLTGEAIDQEPLASGITLMKVLLFIYDNLEFRELIAEFFPKGWVHASYVVGYNKRILKLKDENHDFKVVTIDKLIELYGR